MENGGGKEHSGNIDAFTGRYQAQMSQPFVVITDDGKTLWFTSDQEILGANVDLLGGYLADPSKDYFDAGRSIFAEIVTTDILRASYPDLGESEDFVLVPDGIDASSVRSQSHGRGYQKGSDIYVARVDQVGGGDYPVHHPQLGIDVTLGSQRQIEKKQRRWLPVQIPTATPVIILDLHTLMSTGQVHKRFPSFREFLDGPARGEVLTTGSYRPLAGLNEAERLSLQTNLNMGLLSAIETSVRALTFQRRRDGSELDDRSLSLYIKKLREVQELLRTQNR